MLRKIGVSIVNSHISASWEDCLHGARHTVAVSVLYNRELIILTILSVSNIRTPKITSSFFTHTQKKLEFPHTLPVSGHVAVDKYNIKYIRASEQNLLLRAQPTVSAETRMGFLVTFQLQTLLSCSAGLSEWWHEDWSMTNSKHSVKTP